MAESPAGALIEHLVHLELNEKSWPAFYDLMQVTAPDGVEVETLILPAGDEWKRLPIITRGLKHFHFYSAQWELSEVRLFLEKSRVGSACFEDTRSEN